MLWRWMNMRRGGCPVCSSGAAREFGCGGPRGGPRTEPEDPARARGRGAAMQPPLSPFTAPPPELRRIVERRGHGAGQEFGLGPRAGTGGSPKPHGLLDGPVGHVPTILERDEGPDLLARALVGPTHGVQAGLLAGFLHVARVVDAHAGAPIAVPGVPEPAFLGLQERDGPPEAAGHLLRRGGATPTVPRG